MFNDTQITLDHVVVPNVTVDSISAPKNVSPASLLKDLELKRITWEEGVYRTSNQALYSILSECLMFGGELSTSAAKVRREALNKFCKARGYTVKNDGPLMTHIVKAVFGNVDRRRISTYSLVLREAQNKKVIPTDFADWVEREGGIQEIRLSQSATFVKPTQKVEMGKQQFALKGLLASVRSPELSLLADPDFIGMDCVLLAEQQADGSFEVRALLRQDVVMSAAYTALYAQDKAASDEAKARNKAANDADGVLNDAA